MKIALIILAHQYPQQLLRLAQSLAHPDAGCWIHLDKKCEIEDFKLVFEQPNVFKIEPRLKVGWGCFNTVEAMLKCLQAAISSGKNYDYFHFLSGQDYPLQPVSHFIKYLTENAGFDFVGNRPLEESHQNMVRVSHYYFNDFKLPYRSLLEKIANNILTKRKFPFPFEIRKGPQWMTLTKKAVEFVLDFVKKNPAYSGYFRWTHIPDEFFFQTILYNSPLKQQLKNQIFHYIDWSEKNKNPKVLTMADSEKIFASELFFARKFNSITDSKILDEIDNKIAGLK